MKHSHLGVRLEKNGASFGVWAPNASSVAVTGDFTNWSDTGTPMERVDDGTWNVFIEGVVAGQEYKFVITNGKNVFQKNDPRALQLTAAQDASIITDANFDWQGDDFQLPKPNELVIYELHLGTFNRPDPATPGTFKSASEKLDYLQNLGVNAIELMPVNGTNMERWWGYEPTYLYSVEAAYGGRKAFQEFVLAAHQHGIGVILDVVYNHLTPEPGFDLWQFDGWSKPGKGGIYFYSDDRIETPWGPRPDYGRPEVRQYLLDNARMWLADCHVDGLRLDAVFAIRNARGWNDDPEHDIADGWHLIQKINQLAHNVRASTITIAEDVADNEFITKPGAQGGAGFDAQWETTFPASLRAVLNPVSDEDRELAPLETALAKTYNGGAYQRIIYSESHDADANGHARLNAEIAPDDAANIFARRRSMLAAAITLTAPGIPMLFQGQEFMASGWFNHWDNLDWSLADRFAGTVQFYQDLVALRKNLAGPSAGLAEPHYQTLQLDNSNKVLAYARGENSPVVIIINFSNNILENYDLRFPNPGRWKVILNSDSEIYSPDFTNLGPFEVSVESGSAAITLAPYSVIILACQAAD